MGLPDFLFHDQEVVCQRYRRIQKYRRISFYLGSTGLVFILILIVVGTPCRIKPQCILAIFSIDFSLSDVEWKVNECCMKIQVASIKHQNCIDPSNNLRKYFCTFVFQNSWVTDRNHIWANGEANYRYSVAELFALIQCIAGM